MRCFVLFFFYARYLPTNIKDRNANVDNCFVPSAFSFCQILLGPASAGGGMELTVCPVPQPTKTATTAKDGYMRMFKAGTS